MARRSKTPADSWPEPKKARVLVPAASVAEPSRAIAIQPLPLPDGYKPATWFYEGDKPLWLIKKALDLVIASRDREKVACFCLLYTHKFKRMEDRAHVAVVGPSTAGKSWLLENVAKAMNAVTAREIALAMEAGKGDKDSSQQVEAALQELYHRYHVVLLTGITKESLKRWSFPYDHHVIVLTEMEASLVAAPYLRQMMSEGDTVSLSTEKGADGQLMSMLWATLGKAVIAGTTAQDELEHQFGNRTSLIHLDGEDDAGMYRMMALMNGDPAGWAERVKPLKDLALQTAARPYVDGVSIPYVLKLADSWPRDNAALKRVFNDFCRLLKAVAAIHGRSVAVADDYEMARRLFCFQKHKLGSPRLRALHALKTELEGKMRCLNPTQKLALEQAFKEGRVNPKVPWLDDKGRPLLDLNGNVLAGLTRDEIGEATNLSDTAVYELLQDLINRGIVLAKHNAVVFVDERGRKHVDRMPTDYLLTSYGYTGFDFPSFKDLMGSDYRKGMFVKPYDPLTGEDLAIPEELGVVSA